MAGLFKLSGNDKLKENVKKTQANLRKKLEKRRKEIVAFFVKELMANIPVWSGRTIASIRVNASGSHAPRQGEPSKGARASFGYTTGMALGAEPKRGEAEARAMRAVEEADYDIRKKVQITINSEAWKLVNQAAAPDKARARNRAVVAEIALQATKSKFGL